MRRIAAGLLVGCLCVSACSDAAIDATDDRAISLNSNSAAQLGTRLGWYIDSVPAVVIGEEDGPVSTALNRVGSAIQMPGGEIVITDVGNSVVHVYDSLGRHLQTLGRRGEGPGEFRQLIQARWVAGDTVAAIEFPTGGS